MDSMVVEDEGLWDELHHHQSREILQHRAKQQERLWWPSSSSSSSSFDLRAQAHQTMEELRRFGGILHDAAVGGWRESQNRRRMRREEQRYRYESPVNAAAAAAHNHSNNNSINNNTNNDPHAYLNEFGIPNEDPLLQDYTSFDTSRQRSQRDNDFIFLPNFRFRPENEGWASVPNLDVFFQSLYSYYYHRGLVPIISKGVVELVTLFSTLLLSVFLFAYVDWKGLAQCTDESSCHADFLESYIRESPFQQRSLWNFVIILYCLMFCLYGAFAVLQLANTVQQATNAKWVFEERLGISARKLLGGAVDWDRDVVAKLVALQQSGEYRVAIHNNGQDLDALVIANRILRKENFMVALFNRGLLDLNLPWLSPISDSFFCSSLEWSIYFCVLNFMFNHKYQVRPAFYLDPAALRRRFQVCGIAHIVFMPFLLFFMTVYLGLQNVYDWKSTKQYLGPRDWSLEAKWTFREFNELPHLFERRLGPSYDAAESYLKLFGSNEIITALGRILVFIGGSMGAVLFGFAAMNDAILLHVKIADWNLLWYAGVFGLIYSGGKSMIPAAEAMPKSARNLYAEIDDALVKVAEHTHFYPDTWRGRGWEPATQRAFSNMFKFKAKIFITELLSLVLAPYILCVSLARCAEPICEFVLATRTEVSGAGEVCGYATFDFDKFRDERWDGRTLGETDPMAGSLAESIMQAGSVDEATRRFPKPKARYGKMEKSFFSFKDAHPSWNCTPSGQNLIDEAERSRSLESSAMVREQDLHRAAAARQLETLEQIEEGRAVSSGGDDPPIAIGDRSIPTTQASADAGAGSLRHV